MVGEEEKEAANEFNYYMMLSYYIVITIYSNKGHRV